MSAMLHKLRIKEQKISAMLYKLEKYNKKFNYIINN